MASVSVIDFAATDLAANYKGFYAIVIDDLFTPTECAELIALASTDPAGWVPAAMSALTTESIHSNFRHSETIKRIDKEASEMIYARLQPFVEDIKLIEPEGKWAGITGKPTRKQGETWKMVGINERLSFLRYTPGNFFKRHCDGLVERDDGARKSFVTLHLYLSDSSTSDEPLVGGATRFWTPNQQHFLDVEPKVGRVLVFQQRMLVHSGEPVTSGVKYTMRSEFMYERV
ncbi:hypothetical protein C8J56DRAFT_1157140 [Mycena floridula]|nr:hypothetical protein C8J56DRAFT_1157140 [Mycena floridula]